jgi:hypothetical protein
MANEMSREAKYFILVAVAFLAVAFYIGGYFAVTKTSAILQMENSSKIRWFDSEFLEWLYTPAVRAEAFLTGWDVTSMLLPA